MTTYLSKAEFINRVVDYAIWFLETGDSSETHHIPSDRCYDGVNCGNDFLPRKLGVADKFLLRKMVENKLTIMPNCNLTCTLADSEAYLIVHFYNEFFPPVPNERW